MPDATADERFAQNPLVKGDPYIRLKASSRNLIPLILQRFPSPRWASATNIVRPRESTAETQPQLQPALLRLSAMISQYFTVGNLIGNLIESWAQYHRQDMLTSLFALYRHRDAKSSWSAVARFQGVITV